MEKEDLELQSKKIVLCSRQTDTFSIGRRKEQVDLCLKHAMLSRIHAHISFLPQYGFSFICTSKTKSNAFVLLEKQPIFLPDDSLILIGDEI